MLFFLQFQQNGDISSTGERSPSEPVGDQQSPKHDTISGTFESPDGTTEVIGLTTEQVRGGSFSKLAFFSE